MAHATTNPYTGEVLKTFPDATDREVEQAIPSHSRATQTTRSGRDQGERTWRN